MSEITEAADTLDRFLKEPVVQKALEAIKQDGYRAFLLATDDQSRREAHATAMAAEHLETVFRAVIDAGTRERTEEESADRRLSAR